MDVNVRQRYKNVIRYVNDAGYWIYFAIRLQSMDAKILNVNRYSRFVELLQRLQYL